MQIYQGFTVNYIPNNRVNAYNIKGVEEVNKAYPNIDSWMCKASKVTGKTTGQVFLNIAYIKNMLNLRNKLSKSM